MAKVKPDEFLQRITPEDIEDEKISGTIFGG